MKRKIIFELLKKKSLIIGTYRSWKQNKLLIEGYNFFYSPDSNNPRSNFGHLLMKIGSVFNKYYSITGIEHAINFYRELFSVIIKNQFLL